MERTSPLQVPRINRSRSPSPNRDGRTLYFAYGDNLWLSQMKQRCPTAQTVGIARLRHWRWQINNHGVANVVEAPAAPYSPATARWLGPLMSGNEDLREDSDRTYGIVWRLEKDDERTLNATTGASYEKVDATVEFWAKAVGADGAPLATDIKNGRIQKVRVVMHADRTNTTDGKCAGPYHYKINMGIQDALREGVPKSYVDEYVRPYLPAVDDEGSKLSLAIEEAVRRGLDVKKIVERAEMKLASSDGSIGSEKSMASL